MEKPRSRIALFRSGSVSGPSDLVHHALMLAWDFTLPNSSNPKTPRTVVFDRHAGAFLTVEGACLASSVSDRPRSPVTIFY